MSRKTVAIILGFIVLVAVGVSSMMLSKGKFITSKAQALLGGGDGKPPAVVESEPKADAADVDITTKVIAVFDKELADGSVNPMSFVLKNDKELVGAKVSIVDGKKAVLTPNRDLETMTDYTVILTADVSDKFGSTLKSPFTWKFRTADANWGGPVQLGTAGEDQAMCVASDQYGNVYIAGGTTGGFGQVPNQDTTGETFDAVMVKIDERGRLAWSKQFGTPYNDFVTAIAISQKGNVFMTGWSEGDIESMSGTPARRPSSERKRSVFLVKISATGEEAWRKVMGPGHPLAIGIDEDENVYIAGYTQGNYDDDNTGNNDGFVARFSSYGQKVWVKLIGTLADDFITGMQVVSGEGVYAAGYSVPVQSGAFGSVEPKDASGNRVGMYMVKFRESGKMEYVVPILESYRGATTGLSTDGQYMYVTGYRYSEQKGNRRGNIEAFVSKHKKTGESVWERPVVEWAVSTATEAVLSDNVLYVVGHGKQSESEGKEQGFIVKYAPTGNKDWEKVIVSSWDTNAVSLTYLKRGGLAVAGFASGAMGRNVSAGWSDFFVAKYGLDGSVR